MISSSSRSTAKLHVDVLEPAVFNTAHSTVVPAFQWAVSEDPLSVELELADFVVWWTERVEVDVIPTCSMWEVLH